MGRPKGYIFSSSRGSSTPHYGSAYINSVEKHSGSCPCCDCHQKMQCASLGMSWWSVDLTTACHVIFDTQEAQCTAVDVFYDDETSKSCGRMKTLKGVEVLARNFEADSCKVRCVTHNEHLALELQQVISKYNYKVWTVRNPPLRAVGRLCLIVSHPHGQAKKVTLGKVEAVQKFNSAKNRLIYSTDSCPGSSGGLVLALQDDIGPGTEWLTWALWTSVHCSKAQGLNRNRSNCEIQLLT
ncbi:hypothetical protein PoB_000507100 [Plakobranchus ocellatus]|uniref:Peptidase S1 domain-containing protein n=1 Tax=Plakobranchus ocellatus TaxID=259542 RepID=A0AAV3Y823_9GAST|nr:hypothetical protein PoB_000507100 [Plakobranchus ocellatus]